VMNPATRLCHTRVAGLTDPTFGNRCNMQQRRVTSRGAVEQIGSRTMPTTPAAAAGTAGPAGPRSRTATRTGRIPVVDVEPVVDCGRFPAKAVVGETFMVT